MASIVSGLEYDIFISYRHNDNKYDGWVSQFVSNLDKELQATVKSKLSIYFDENPHDGLLETDNVDASLSSKVRSLIFIPIISKTYCDGESYAWKNEFLPFIKSTGEDQIGPTVRLPNGNVANRVLPIRIHDIDQEDTRMFERELNAAMRPIEFAYKSKGVNRPLRSQDDDLKGNPNQAIYRDQINKAANAIREIITGLKSSNDRESTLPRNPIENSEIGLIEIKKIGTINRWIFAALVAMVAGAAIYYWFPREPAARDKSIAVLPFTNMSSDPELEYFCDGIVEDILDKLTKVSDLKLPARTSVLKYKGTKKDISEIGKELGVLTIVEGSVRKFGKSYRIVIQLIDVNTGFHIGESKTYDYDGDDIRNISDEVSRQTAIALSVSLEELETGHSKKISLDPNAYKLYLKGRFFWNLRGRYLPKAINAFRDAISIDPSYAAAYSGLADCYTALGYASAISPDEAFPKARTAAEKALELDPNLSDPHASLGYIKFYFDWDWNGAEEEFRKAISLNPKYAIAYQWYGWYLTSRQRFAEAERIMEKAEDLDSLSAPIYTDMAFSLYYGGNLDRALKQLQSSLSLNDTLALTHVIMGRVYQDKKMYKESINEYQKSLLYAKDWPVSIAGLGNVYGFWGKSAEAKKMLDRLEELSAQGKFVTPYGVALIYCSLGNKDKTFEWLNKAYEGRSHWLVWLKLDPRWSTIRSEKRFTDLVNKIGL